MNHITPYELQEYLDALLPAERKNEIGAHCAQCPECSKTLRTMQRLDTALRKIPIEHAAQNFTRRVMAKLEPRKSSGFLWFIFRNLAPVLGIITILVIIYYVLQLTGAYDTSEISKSIAATQSVYATVHTSVGDSVAGLTKGLKTLFPFLYTKGSYGLLAFVLILFGFVALLDKMVIFPFFKRRI
jgi:hypothetical protein